MGGMLHPRQEFQVFKAGGSGQQVPAAATIQFYRQGATVLSEPVVANPPNQFLVTVQDIGEIVVNDTVQVGPAGATGTVVSVTGRTELVVQASSGNSFPAAPGARLVPTNSPPGVFSDAAGQQSLGTSIQTDAGTGRAGAYLSRNRVDCKVTGTGVAARVLADVAGEHGRSDLRWVDLRDFGGDLQAAIDALPADGGTVLFPDPVTTLTAPVAVNKPNVAFLGEQQGNVIRPATVNAFDLITVERAGFSMADLRLDGGATVGTSYSNPKSCLVARGLAAYGYSVAGMNLRKVQITGAPGYGLWLRGADEFFARGSYFLFNAGSGIRIEASPGTARNLHFEACASGQNGGRGLHATDVNGLLMVGSAFEGNRGGWGDLEGNGVEAHGCKRLALRSCYFEDAHSKDDAPAGTERSKQFVLLDDCPGGIVEGTWFQGGNRDDLQPYRPVRAVRFKASPNSLFSNCGAEEIHSFVARFDSDSPDCVEMGTRDQKVGVTIPRIDVQATRFFGMSRRALGVPTHASETALENDAPKRAGALVWVTTLDSGGTKRLRVCDGSGWVGVSHS